MRCSHNFWHGFWVAIMFPRAEKSHRWSSHAFQLKLGKSIAMGAYQMILFHKRAGHHSSILYGLWCQRRNALRMTTNGLMDPAVIPMSISIILGQWAFQEPIYWRYLPYMFGLFFRPKFQGIYPQFLWLGVPWSSCKNGGFAGKIS